MVNYIKISEQYQIDLYIWFRCKLDWAYIILLRVIDAYLDLLGFIGEDITCKKKKKVWWKSNSIDDLRIS